MQRTGPAAGRDQTTLDETELKDTTAGIVLAPRRIKQK